MKHAWPLAAVAGTLAIPVPASARPVTLETQLSDYGGDGAYVAIYLTGHGIHLAANSISNAHPSDTAHLWDEVAGHAVWYAGAVLIGVALADTMLGRPRPGAIGYLLAVGVGVTWATNVLGASNLVVMGLIVAAAATGYGWRHRAELGVVFLVGFAPAVVVLVGGLLVD